VNDAVRGVSAAGLALGAYLTTVLPRARRELRRWGPLPSEKERNAEAVAVFATLAPRSERAGVLRAILALQVAIDLRDMCEEGNGPVGAADARLLERLQASWREDAAALPAHEAVEPLLERAVERCEEGQRRTHAAAAEETDALRDWATTLGAPPEYRWWEVAAGASSSVAAHALIAAAADPATTAETAALIDAAYQPPVGALTVLLDDLVDRDEDFAAGEHNYLGYYASPAEAAERLGLLAERAEDLLSHLPNSDRHRAILAGVAGFYLSAPTAATPSAQPIRSRLLVASGPGGGLLSAFMRLRRLGERKRPEQAGNSPGP
jgi:tetraprenyl-beta-curcumene synthase